LSPPPRLASKTARRIDVDTSANSQSRAEVQAAVAPDYMQGIEILPEPVIQSSRLSPPPKAQPRYQPGSRKQMPEPSADIVAQIRSITKKRIEGKAIERRGNEPQGTALAPIRSTETSLAYAKRGRDLVNKFRRERDLASDIETFDPIEFVTWCLGRRRGLKPSTWRQYRQAIMMVLEPMDSPRAEQAIKMVEFAEPEDVEMGTSEWEFPEGEAKKMTSSKKAKALPLEEVEKIFAYIKLKRRSNISSYLANWLRAGLSTGLRPKEWQTTELKTIEDRNHPRGRRVYLFVINAKATNERSNGLVRTLDLSDFTDAMISAVATMSETGRAWFEAGTFTPAYSQCQQMLFEIGKALWPRRRIYYSLYSCRHQFIANMKSLDVPLEEISAMVGHLVDETAAVTYGRRRSAWSPDRIVDRAHGVRDEVATVRRVLHTHEDNMRLRRLIMPGKSSSTD